MISAESYKSMKTSKNLSSKLGTISNKENKNNSLNGDSSPQNKKSMFMQIATQKANYHVYKYKN